MKRKRNDVVLPVTIGIIAFYAIYFASPSAPLIYIPNVPNDGFVKVDIRLDGTALQFSSQCYSVTMNIHELQALSIRNGIDNRIDVRPLTHDVLREIMNNFGIKVLEIRIESFENEIYRAKTFVQQGNKVLDIDTRPSDGIGIAVRTGAPVYFNKQLLESNGVNTCK